ncbi:MAG: hypothetical protein WC054_01420 [Candidatus Nanopelagicales bacterium]
MLPPLSTEHAVALARAYVAVISRHPDGSLDQVFAAFESVVPNLFDRVLASLLSAYEEAEGSTRLGEHLKLVCREEIAQSRMQSQENEETEWRGAFTRIIREIEKFDV